tara:strand:- start:1374 stop:1769 length:396 start_codon:yes stop_codon:yes gene_type:complete
MTWVRVYHKLDGEVVARERRADEWRLGAGAYTDENVVPAHAGLDWLVCDIEDFYEGEGDAREEVPWGTASITNAGLSRGQRAVQQDSGAIATAKADAKTKGDRKKALDAKLVADTATAAEMRELMRIERGL